MFEVTDMQKIGVGLAGFGISFLFLGVILLFDKGLLAIGNILFIVGLACVIGLERTFRFFFQRHKAKATAAFFGGIFVVLLGWPLVGMIIETYGFVLLFRWSIDYVVIQTGQQYDLNMNYQNDVNVQFGENLQRLNSQDGWQ